MAVLGVLLGCSWGALVVLLGSLGTLLVPLGCSWVILGMSWDLFGCSWAALGVLLGVVRVLLGLFSKTYMGKRVLLGVLGCQNVKIIEKTSGFMCKS